MDAIPSHCTLQPPVLKLTGPHPGGASQPKSIGDAKTAIAKILPRPMRPPEQQFAHQCNHLDRPFQHYVGLSRLGKMWRKGPRQNGTVKCEGLVRLLIGFEI